ncbi:DUF2505 domain-containing protein [Dermacoccaceae bacterium W4C1]
MKITQTWSYPADPDAVWAMMTDPAFLERRCVASGALSQTVSVTEEGEVMVLKTVRTMPTDQVPEKFRRFLSNGLKLTEVQRWNPATEAQTRNGTIEVTVDGAPAAMKGELSMVPEDDGVRVAVEGDFKVSIPLVGSQIEKKAEPLVSRAIGVEEREGRAWLAR